MKKKYAIVLIFICVLAAAAFVAVKGRVQGNENELQSTDPQVGSGVVYLYYANTFLSIDKDGIVCDNSSARPDKIPLIEGVDFSRLTFGRKAQQAEDGALEYVLKVASCLEKHGIEADRISYSNRMVSVYIGNLEIRLGKNEKTEDKINDLDNFIDKIPGSGGILYMQNANANNYGYTFRAK